MKNKLVVFIMLMIILISCNQSLVIEGVYKNKSNEFNSKIELNSDSTFVFYPNDNNLLPKQKTMGKWNYDSKFIYLNNKCGKNYSDSITEAKILEDSILVQVIYFDNTPCIDCSVFLKMNDSIMNFAQTNEKGICIFQKTIFESISIIGNKYREDTFFIKYTVKNTNNNAFYLNITHDEFACFENQKWKIKGTRLIRVESKKRKSVYIKIGHVPNEHGT